MNRWFLAGFAALLVASVAQADDPMKQDPTKQPGSMQGTKQPGTMQQGTMQQGTMQKGSPDQAAMGESVQLAGVVSSVDKTAKTMTVVAPLGEREDLTKVGDAFLIDEKYSLVAIGGAYDPKATITRDGKMVKWSDLKEGDIIRTSYDPNTNSFAGGTATSKETVKKEFKKDMKDLKKNVKAVDDMAK